MLSKFLQVMMAPLIFDFPLPIASASMLLENIKPLTVKSSLLILKCDGVTRTTGSANVPSDVVLLK